MKRRDVLATGATLTALGLAGCLHSDDSEDRGDLVDVDGFRTLWRTDNLGETDDDQVALPLKGYTRWGHTIGPYDFEVDWGDGTSDTIDSHDAEAATHTYDAPGEYEVSISGTLPGFSFRIPGHGTRGPDDRNKLVEIREWGGLEVGSHQTSEETIFIEVEFVGAENLSVTADDGPYIREGARLDHLFENSGISDADLSGWDISGAESISRMFLGAIAFDGDVSDWNVSNVKRMDAMFLDAESFDGDVSDWDVSNVVTMEGMFRRAKSFNGDVSEWDVSNVENMNGLFKNATSFDGDVSSWDVSNVETMGGLFKGAKSFDGYVSDWDISNVGRRMHGMLEGSGLTRDNYDSLLLTWQHLDLEPGVRFGAGETQYSSGEPAEARQYIIEEYDWVITDGGPAE